MTTKTEAASEVRKILQSVKDRIAMPGGTKVNEATTRAHFVTPLLGALGYRSIDDILFEVYLPDGKTFLDYSLVVDAKPRVSVEAKALESHLTDKDAAQVVQYANLLGDKWSVVTNAREWRLYETFAHASTGCVEAGPPDTTPRALPRVGCGGRMTVRRSLNN